MNLLIVGATGGTGQQVVTQALERGHRVTALVRRPPPVLNKEQLRREIHDTLGLLAGLAKPVGGVEQRPRRGLAGAE